MKLLLVVMVVVAGAMVGSARTTEAHPFEAPEVSVVVSKLEAGGHPDVQTTITLDEGEPFATVRIESPPGSRIASPADIWDGAIVGRLDAVATTNGITRPNCDLTVPFSVDIVKATNVLSSPEYPPYLHDVAPGQHWLRFVADVSPAPDIPLLINYLYDVDPDTGALTTLVVIGDPDHPHETFQSCTPLTSRTTLFGELGTFAPRIPLITSPDPLPETRLPFRFKFTSRPDSDGHVHTREVEVRASLPPPRGAIENLTFAREEEYSGRLTWKYEGMPEFFNVEVVITSKAGYPSYSRTFAISGGRRQAPVRGSMTDCYEPNHVYRVTAVSAGTSGVAAETGDSVECPVGPGNPDLQGPVEDLELTAGQGPPYVILLWDHPSDGQYEIQVLVLNDAGGSEQHTFILDNQSSFAVAPRFAAWCDSPGRITYRVKALGLERSAFRELVGGTDVNRDCVWRNSYGILPPDTGSGGPSAEPFGWRAWVVLAAGAAVAAGGIALRPRCAV